MLKTLVPIGYLCYEQGLTALFEQIAMIRSFALTLFAVFALAPCVSQAHTVVYRDPDFKIDVSYPDDWKAQGGLPGDARYRVMAGADSAQCTVFAKKDRRYVIYPRDYVTDILAQDMQWDYWEQAAANYDDLTFYYDNFGALDGGPARYTLVDYIDRTPEKNGQAAVRKRAWIYGAIAGDMHINVTCSSTLDTFEQHAGDFGQIIDSVQFPAPYAERYRGGYRDFLDKEQMIDLANTVGPIFVYLLPRAGWSRVLHCPLTPRHPACLFKPKPRQILTR